MNRRVPPRHAGCCRSETSAAAMRARLLAVRTFARASPAEDNPAVVHPLFIPNGLDGLASCADAVTEVHVLPVSTAAALAARAEGLAAVWQSSPRASVAHQRKELR